MAGENMQGFGVFSKVSLDALPHPPRPSVCRWSELERSGACAAPRAWMKLRGKLPTFLKFGATSSCPLASAWQVRGMPCCGPPRAQSGQRFWARLGCPLPAPSGAGGVVPLSDGVQEIWCRGIALQLPSCTRKDARATSFGVRCRQTAAGKPLLLTREQALGAARLDSGYHAVSKCWFCARQLRCIPCCSAKRAKPVHPEPLVPPHTLYLSR